MAVGQLPDTSTAARRALRLEALVTLKLGGSSSSITFGPVCTGGCRTSATLVVLKLSSASSIKFGRLRAGRIPVSGVVPSFSVSWRLACASLILTRCLSVEVAMPLLLSLKISMSKSTAARILPLTGTLPRKSSHKSSVARKMASVSVTAGCVRYLWRKKTVCPTRTFLVSLIHTLWQR